MDEEKRESCERVEKYSSRRHVQSMNINKDEAVSLQIAEDRKVEGKELCCTESMRKEVLRRRPKTI
jgi:hypothetical protein